MVVKIKGADIDYLTRLEGGRWLICGGRHFTDWEEMGTALDGLVHHFGKPDTVIHGGAAGADTLAGMWAVARGIRTEVFEADWSLGKAAGMIRNQEMIDHGKPTIVIGFEGGKGTSDMMERARRAEIAVARVVKEE